MSGRVIAGSAKGRRLKLVPGDSTRPIMDRVKEALFSIIGSEIRDTQFLDLFAGTGSVGIEALSRGAERAIFVELDRKAVQTIIENLKHTQLDAKGIVRHIDAFAMLKRAPDAAYDFIYVAPPQYKGIWKQALEAIDNSPEWLHPNITIIVQIDPKEDEAIKLNLLHEYDRRRYGKTLLLFYQLATEDNNEES
jgi:16S rRNA (guanine966-N2)-methyltransferase